MQPTLMGHVAPGTSVRDEAARKREMKNTRGQEQAVALNSSKHASEKVNGEINDDEKRATNVYPIRPIVFWPRGHRELRKGGCASSSDGDAEPVETSRIVGSSAMHRARRT